MQDVEIIKCTQCGGKNRVPADKGNLAVTCGHCGSRLDYAPEPLKYSMIERIDIYVEQKKEDMTPLLECISMFARSAFTIGTVVFLCLICIMGFIMSVIKLWANHNSQPYYGNSTIMFNLVFGLCVGIGALSFLVSIAKGIRAGAIAKWASEDCAAYGILLLIMFIIAIIESVTILGTYNDVKDFSSLYKVRRHYLRTAIQILNRTAVKDLTADDEFVPYIIPKVIIINSQSGLIEVEVQKTLPVHLMAKEPNNVGTVAVVSEGKTKVGLYGGFSGKIAYRPFLDVTLIDWAKKVIIAKQRWQGDPPPDYASTSRTGERPSKHLVAKYITAISEP